MIGKLTAIDLFCGCGGFSLGASLAGFKNVLSVDLDPILTSSYQKNFPKSNLLLEDLSNGLDLSSVVGRKKIDAIIGGPPCQGFSMSGKRNKNDPRNMLVSHFFKHVLRVRPKFFIMENVEGIISGYAKVILEAALNHVSKSYEIFGPIKIKASQIGAATTRPRVIIIGYDKRYVDKIQQEDIDGLFVDVEINVRDAISDLPGPVLYGQETDFGWAKYGKNSRGLSLYAKELRASPRNGLGWKPAIDYLNKKIVSGLCNTNHSKEVRYRFKKLKMGQIDPISRYTRLDWTKPSHTLRAGTGADKGSYQAPRPIHPDDSRVITVREAARLQGFPDWFVFHPAKWHSFRMIGNSVSPIMSEKLMAMMSKKIES